MGIKKQHLKYDSIEEWMEKENVPSGFAKIDDDRLRNKYFDEYIELRQHLFDKHIKSLSEEDQELFAKGEHPSQSWKFETQAKPYAETLETELSSLDFIEKVSLGYYQMDRIILSVDINREISTDEFKMIPWLYKGFETKVGIAQQSSDVAGDRSISKKDLEKRFHQSKKAMVGHVVFTLVTVIAAFAVWKIWSPSWWVYLLILWAGPFGLVGDLINICYCKNKIKSVSD